MRSIHADGAAIRRARELAGLTQDALARKLRVDRSAVAHWENGKTQPSARNFKALRRALRVTAESLMVVPDEQAA